MALVAGIDFGTQSVRVSIVHSEKSVIGTGVSHCPLLRKREDVHHATQQHEHQLQSLIEAMGLALDSSGVDGNEISAVAIATTGSSVIPVGEGLVPIDDYYMWCDHRATKEASAITDLARSSGLEGIRWCGGTYSSEWGFSKVLHWLRHNPEKRSRFVSAFENCDLIVAALCGITDLEDSPRSICVMGHKWMYNAKLGGLPSEEFLTSVDPLLSGIRDKMRGIYSGSNRIAGGLSAYWAEKLGLRAGIPIPVGSLDAHWDAIGAGVRPGDVVNVVGTSTCIIAIGENIDLIPGVCGVVEGSVHPLMTGIEAGLAASGDIFDAIARRAGKSVAEMSQSLEGYRAGQTGLLRVVWDNGDRTVLANAELGGITLGWNLMHSAEDELFAAIEGTALHTRIILERMSEHGVRIDRIINGGGIPQKSDLLNQVYANVLGRAVLVPAAEVTGLGSAIFAFLASGTFGTVEEAQGRLCPKYRVFTPDPGAVAVYEELFKYFKQVYFGFGTPGTVGSFGDVLPALRRISVTSF